MSKFESGGTETTRIGFINRNKKKCTGHRGVAGNGPGQLAYRSPPNNLTKVAL